MNSTRFAIILAVVVIFLSCCVVQCQGSNNSNTNGKAINASDAKEADLYPGTCTCNCPANHNDFLTNPYFLGLAITAWVIESIIFFCVCCRVCNNRGEEYQLQRHRIPHRNRPGQLSGSPQSSEDPRLTPPSATISTASTIAKTVQNRPLSEASSPTRQPNAAVSTVTAPNNNLGWGKKFTAK